MRRFTQRWSCLALIVVSVGCDGGGVLVVRLQSDLVPGVEVARVTLAVTDAEDGARLATGSRTFAAGADLLGGEMVAELAVGAGRRRVVAELHDPSGALVTRREVLLTVRDASVVTVVVTRSCRGVTCPSALEPAATECLGGVCVSPECTPETPERCPTPACVADAECPPVGPTCLAPACLGGVCGVAPDPGACESGATCDPDRGCVPDRTDAGSPDAGPTDAGVDAGSRGTGLVTVEGSFASCPREPPFCLTFDRWRVRVIDPRDGSSCEGPAIRFDPAHSGDSGPVGDFAMIGDTVYSCSEGSSDSWAYRIDMRADTVEDVRVGAGEGECHGIFEFGGELALGGSRGFETYASWSDLRAGRRSGAAIGMCTDTTVQLQWDVSGGTLYGAWFSAAELTTCEIATGSVVDLPLGGFDDHIRGLDVGAEIHVLSRSRLEVFDRAGGPARTVPLDRMVLDGRGLECVF